MGTREIKRAETLFSHSIPVSLSSFVCLFSLFLFLIHKKIYTIEVVDRVSLLCVVCDKVWRRDTETETGTIEGRQGSGLSVNLSD